MCRYGYLGDRDEHTLNLGEILGRLRRYRELTLSNLVLLVSLPISQGHWRTAIVWTCYTRFSKEQNQANHMCAQEVHTYDRIKKYQKQCYDIIYT
jgi:hypothetical protein